MMPEPTNAREFQERFAANQYTSGFGLTDVVNHMPCPFCAAPDWVTYNLVDTEEAFARGATCAECGRTAKAIIERTEGSIQFEFVQTGGDDPATWHQPPMRRVEEVETETEDDHGK